MDVNSEPIIGATIAIKGTATGTMADTDGNFSLNVSPSDSIAVSFIGYEAKTFLVGDNTRMTIILQEAANVLDDVVVTAWGTEKKTTLVGSVSTIKPKELKGPTSNLTNMLAGRVAGLISYQVSGEPGRDNSEFFVRGVGTFGTGGSYPLILINNVESSTDELARIQPDDIESFSVLKDATAASMYGTRGANGVLLITTKSGTEGKTKFNIRYEGSVSSNTKDYNLTDNITYMELANEATLTRNPLKTRPYSLKKIERTKAGADPLIYPNNNWKDIMIKDNTFNHRVNLNVSGGSQKARYYISGTFKRDNGVLKTHELNDFNTNVRNTTYEVRSNTDLDLTSTTVASVRVSGQFNERTGPIGDGESVFKNMLKANPVAFPAIYPTSFIPWSKHPLFGNDYMLQGNTASGLYFNPYAQALSGYNEYSSSSLLAQFELSQDFKFITPGLRGRLMAYTKRYTSSSLSRPITPFYYNATMDPDKKDVIQELNLLNEDSAKEYLRYEEGGKYISVDNWLEMSLSYEKLIAEDHNLSGSLLGYISDKKVHNAGSLELSLPYRNASLSGRLTYGFKNRYLAEFNFGYNASERFDKKHRWGFFPSFGLAWNIAEEGFMEPYNNVFNKIKLRASYGLLGSDNISDGSDGRFFYMSMVNMTPGSYMHFGNDYGKPYEMIYMQRYANPDITWEKSKKTNLALDLGLFNAINVEADFFFEKRSNILMTRADIPKSMGLATGIKANVGESKSKGFEITADYNRDLSKNAWLQVRGTFTYATNEMTVYEEPEYPDNLRHLSRIGYPINTHWGLIAERLFIDEEEVANSPWQGSNVMAGDIKYRDVNGDGKITNDDMVPMGYPTVPEVVYGFGFSLGYKDFDFNAFFQGQARSSFMINAGNISPFAKSGGQQNGLLQVIADDHWSEENRNPYAFFPRLSSEVEYNNTQTSSWWLRDGSFIRLKTVELGYQPKGKWLKRTGLNSLRLYANAMNLFTISKFKLWDVEMRGEGLGYPLQRVFNAGIQLEF
jgi:TonB-linked SusC/RagA family outer membrane protein